jgi:glycine/serine hydroxymethyltransferase
MQEITHWGMAPADMPYVAKLIARVLVRGEAPARVRPDVVVLRQGFHELYFVR